jgi:type IV secretory pathway TrbF-like protein
MPSKTLDQAIAKAHELPEADQEQIGRELNDYIDHLRALRSDITLGIRSLDAGHGRQVDIEEVIAQARATHAGA